MLLVCDVVSDFYFSGSKQGGGGVGVAVYDPYYGKETCFANAKVCFI